MKTIEDLVCSLEKLDIDISLDGERLLLNAPRGVLTQELQSELKLRKGELLEYLAGRKKGGVAQAAISHVSREADLPLSFSQQRLWVLDRFDPGNPVYNIAEALRITGKLDVAALQQSLAGIIDRHEILRTTFLEKNGEPVQIISGPAGFELPVVDMDDKAGGDQEAGPGRMEERLARQPFDLEQGPLFRATLVRRDESKHTLVLVMHHIIFDGWSFDVFYRELDLAYEAACSGQSATLDDLPVQYADFSCWQREYLQGEVLDSGLTYWKSRMQTLPAGLDLPVCLPRPAQQSYQGARSMQKLPAGLQVALDRLGRREGTTLYMTLLTAFQVLLYRYTGEHDLCIGTPVAGRNRVEIEPLLGFFVNTLVLRGDLSGNPSFCKLLGLTRSMALGAYEHQDLPFEKLVEILQPERDLSRTPLFQIMFTWQKAPAGAVTLHEMEVLREAIDIGTSKFDLTLAVEDTGEGLLACWEYATDLFAAPVIARMQEHFHTLLEAIVENPDCSIQSLRLLSEEERSKQLYEWNQTETEYPVPVCLHELFEQQARKTPSAVAVIFEGEQLSYRELNSRANRLAHYLLASGTGPDVRVGICAERSLEMVVGLLGILKAGAAYVPLDPEYPPERLAFLLEDADIKILLMQSHLSGRLPEHDKAVFCLDDGGEELATQGEENPAAGATADSLAYVIYTSGSTGLPKGVMIEHGGICNRLFWMQYAYPLTVDDRVLQKTPYSFDVSVWEFFWPLMTGACLVVARPEGHRDSAYLVELIEAQEISTLHFVPSMLQVFLQEKGLQRCSSLKRVICSGEALPHETQQDFFEKLDAELHNLYGPTEASIDVTYWACQADSPLQTVPIGRPIANTRLYILDGNLQPAPIGVPGELYIAGAGLARGYLNRPELTAETFITDPFSRIPGSRMYRSGDLARYLPDGNIEFMGRLDFQVKIRGYRIEPGEIEAVLMRHPAIREAVVLAREDVPGDKRLVAYLTPVKGGVPATVELRSYLRGLLPDYMIPAAFVSLDVFPVTMSGKLDRKALPAPGRVGLQSEDELAGWSGEEYVQPRDALEYRLSEIWEETFDAQLPIGIHDDFFEIGGHSLLAVRLFSQLEKVVGSKLPLAVLYKAPTIARLADVIREGGVETEWSPLVQIHEGSPGKRPVFLMHLADGVIFHLHLRLGRYLGTDQPVYGLQARGVDGIQEPHRDFETMAADYIDEIRAMQPEGPYQIIAICDGATIAVEMARQLVEQDHEVGLLVLVVPTEPPRMVKPLTRIKQELTRSLKGHPSELARVADAHFDARFRYMPKKYPGRIVFIEALKDPPDMKNIIRSQWEELVNGGLELHCIPGDHNSSVREPLVQGLAEKLRGYLGS